MILATSWRVVPLARAGRIACTEGAYCASPRPTSLPSTTYAKAYRKEVAEIEESIQFGHERVNVVVRAKPEEGVIEHEPPVGEEGTTRVVVAIAREVSEWLSMFTERVNTWVDPGTKLE